MTSDSTQYTREQLEFIELIKDLPTLPAVVAQIMVTLDQPTSSARDLERLVANDQAIAARLLKLANSAFYGLPGKVTNLSRGITLLGFNTVRSLVLTIGVVDQFNSKSGSELFNKGEFWEHSLSVAVASRLFASKNHSINPDEAHMAGLLHDMGTIILDTCMPEKFHEVMIRAIANPEEDPRIIEKDIIGFGHDEAGAIVAEKWKFPDFIREAMAYHHEPYRATDHPEITQIVAISNKIVRGFEKQEKNGEDYSIIEFWPELREVWLPTPRDEELFITKYEVDVERVQDILALFGE